MNKKLKLTLFFAFLLCFQAVYSQNGTADGTYHFGNLGADNSAGTGFKKQGDKFAISNITLLDPSDNSIYYGQKLNIGSQGDITIKAEGGTVCKRFTLRDMDLYTYAGGVYIKKPYSKFTISLYNEANNLIASHQISSTVEIGAGAITKLKDIPFTTAWPTNGYNLVARIELSFIANSNYPEVLGFKNMTIANVSAITLPVNFGQLTATVKSGNLQVDWTTFSEKNNDKFVIQSSANGTSWTDIATVKAKSSNGNSDIIQHYHFETPWSTTALAGVGLLALLLLPAGRNRRYQVLMGILLACFLISCAKNSDSSLDVLKLENNKTVGYVRLAQFDKDGNINYSQVTSIKK